jgi:hypothetical protein
MWSLILLSGAVLAWAQWMQQDLELSADANREVEARAMAQSGVAVALHPMVSEQTPLLEEEFGPQLGYKVRIISEGGKLNIKWLLTGEDPRKITIFKQWLERKEIGFKERETLVDCLLDYIDGDDVTRLNGSEGDDRDKYAPANRPLESVEELLEVRGTEPLTSIPGWKEELTVDSGGPIDMTAASFEVLRLLPGLGEARIQRFITFRRGKDGIDGTKDDNVFKGLTDIQRFLALSDPQFQELGGLIVPKDPTVHITSVGYSAKMNRQLVVVARKGTGNPTIYRWKE